MKRRSCRRRVILYNLTAHAREYITARFYLSSNLDIWTSRAVSGAGNDEAGKDKKSKDAGG